MSQASIAKLRTLSPQLNESTDEANRVVAMVEKFLNDECSIGLPAEVGVSTRTLRVEADDDDEATTATEYTTLNYARVDGTFRIAVEVGLSHEGADERGMARTEWEQTSLTPWASCPRSVKLETFPSLADLLKAICESTEKAIEQTAETSKAVEDILGALEG